MSGQPAVCTGAACIAVAVVLALAGCRSKRALLPRGEGAAVVVVSGEGPENASSDLLPATEREPNNNLATAQVLSFSPEPLNNGSPVPELSISGVLDPPSDVDLYRLMLAPGLAAPQSPDVDAGQPPVRFSISLQVAAAAEASEALRLEVSQGEVSLLRTTIHENNLLAPNLPFGQGELVVRVTRARPKGELPLTYSLRAQPRRLSVGEEAEPNGTVAQATPAVAPTATTEMVGHLGWRQDTDWFAVSFPFGLQDSGLGLELRIPESGLAQVAFADAQGIVQHGHTRAAGGVLTLQHVKPPADGPVVYVRVQNVGPAVPGERYRLSVTATPWEPNVEREPNDTTDQAQPLTDSQVKGHIHPVGDVDTFKVCGPLNGSWSVRPPPRITLSVAALDGDGNVFSQQAFEAPGTMVLPSASETECQFIQIREVSHKRLNSQDFYELMRAQ